MPTFRSSRPQSSEFLPYYGKYIDLVSDGDLIATLVSQMEETQSLLREIPPSMSGHRYAEGKWSINEVVGHVADAERIFTTRALRFARNDAQPLPGFEQNDYVKNANFDKYPLAELASELANIRQASIYLFSHLDEEAWLRRGTASGAV